MASEAITYDKAELRSITRAFKAMDDEAIDQAKSASSELADYVKSKIVVLGSFCSRRDNESYHNTNTR